MISLVEAVTRITVSAGSSRVISSGLPRLNGRCSLDLAKRDETLYEIVHVAERASLRAVAEHSEGLAVKLEIELGRPSKGEPRATGALVRREHAP